MEKMIDRKSLLLMGKALANPEYKRAFIIAIMNDEDYEKLRNLYIKLDKKDKEIENKNVLFSREFDLNEIDSTKTFEKLCF